MTIIKLEPVNGVHPVERQSHRTSNWMGEGWAEVPEHLAEQAFACGGSCELTLEDGVLTALTAIRRPEELDAPTPQEDADALLVDHEYRLTLLELGLTAE